MPNSSSITLDSVRVLFEKGTYFGNDSIFALPGKTVQGVEGIVLPYSPQQDLALTVVIVAQFLLLCFALGQGIVPVSRQLKEFFSERERGNLFADQGGSYYPAFLVLQTAIVFGVLVFSLWFRPRFPTYVLPSWLLLGWCLSGGLAYVAVKFLLYKWINWVFFDSARCSRWMDTLSLVISLQGVFLFPVVCLNIYSNLVPQYVLIITTFIVFFSKMLLFYKSKSIFFRNMRGLFYNILYLCTLEMIPLVILWKVIREISWV